MSADEWVAVYSGPEIEARLRAGYLDNGGVSTRLVRMAQPPVGAGYGQLQNFGSSVAYEQLLVPASQLEEARRLLAATDPQPSDVGTALWGRRDVLVIAGFALGCLVFAALMAWRGLI